MIDEHSHSTKRQDNANLEGKERMENLNDRTWPYHGMGAWDFSVEQVLERSHFRQIRPHKRHAAFSFAMTVMDELERWNGEEWVWSTLAACMWIYTKAVLRDGRKRDPLLDLQLFLGINVESVSWVAEDFLWEREWITETKSYHERKSHSGGTEL